MKTTLSILGAVCFVLGFAMATGVDQNPVQAVYCVVLMLGALVCFNRAEAISSRTSAKTPKQKVYDYKLGTFRDVA